MNYKEIDASEYEKLMQNRKIFLITIFKIQIN